MYAMARNCLRTMRVLLAALVAIASTCARAEERAKVIGYLTPAAQISLRETVLQQGLRELGWLDGKNIRLEYARAGNDPRRLRRLADDLVREKVDVIVAVSTPAVQAAKAATSTIPVVSL